MRQTATGLSDAQARATAAILIALIAAALIVPALMLRANGLWTDELFTSYFSDPSAGWGAALLRAAEDVHPPAYALLIGLLRRITGSSTEVAARGFAILCSAATLAVLASALRQRMGKLPLLFTLSTVALSGSFLSVVAEARSYALTELLVTIDMALILRLRSDGGGQWARTGLAALLILGGLVHSYLALVGVALSAYLLLTADGWRGRISWAMVALLVALCAQAVATWQAPYVVPAPAQTWFSAAFADQAVYILRGMLLVVASPLGIAVILLAIAAVPWGRSHGAAITPQAVLRSTSAMAVFVIVATIAAAVAYTTLITPVLSRRLFLVIAPFFWLLAAEVYRVTLARPGHLIPAILLAAALAGGLRIADAGQQQIEPWRASARAIAALPDCDGEPITVVGFDEPYVRGDEAAAFYGHYLNAVRPHLSLVRRDADAAAIADAALRAHRVSRCPVLLWSVHHMRRKKVLDVAEIMRRDPRVEPGFGIGVDSFTAPLPVSLLPHFGRRVAASTGFIIRLTPLPR